MIQTISLLSQGNVVFWYDGLLQESESTGRQEQRPSLQETGVCVCVWVDVWRREGGRCGVHVEGGYVRVNNNGKRCEINVS